MSDGEEFFPYYELSEIERAEFFPVRGPAFDSWFSFFGMDG